MGVRVHQLAKELGMTSKDLIHFLRTQGHNVKTHMSSIESTVVTILRDRMKPKTPPKPKATETAGKAETKGKKAPGKAAAPARGGKRDGDKPGSTSGDRPARGGKPTRPAVGGRPATGGAKPWESGGAKAPRKVRYFPEQDPMRSFNRPMGGGRRPGRRKGGGGGRVNRGAVSLPAELPDRIEVEEPVTFKKLSAKLGVKIPYLMKKLLEHGLQVMVNHTLDDETVLLLSADLGTEITVQKKEAKLVESIRSKDDYTSDTDDLKGRPPVVTFLGHVDHGKTSLLDKIRKTRVTSEEQGGITQHIGAYQVDSENVKVTFIDTPGHKAFTEMRARGANVTDIAVIIVAADDGPMPQTEEAINHARAAGVKIVVALNKIDKPEANLQRAKEGLAKLNLMPVEWHGDTEFVEVSAITGAGIDSLLEILDLEAKILELKADPGRPAVGVVLESEATADRGALATVLVQDGTLRVGDYVLCGSSHGRVRNLYLNGVVPVEEAGPSTPVKVSGLSGVPETASKLYVFETEREAREIAESRHRDQQETARLGAGMKALPTDRDSLLELLSKKKAEELPLVIKGDVRGTVDTLRMSLEQLSTDEVKVKVLHAGVGAINQDDVNLAFNSSALVLGYNVSADERGRAVAEENGVDIRLYGVIYKAIEDISAALEGRLAPEISEEVRGHAQIRQLYKASRVGNIAGCIVLDGVISRNDKIRLLRNDRILHTGELSSLKRFKDDAKDVREGFECGIKIAGYEDIQPEDVIESFVLVETKRKL